jgi:DNA-binding transcriptional LysR family regulator
MAVSCPNCRTRLAEFEPKPGVRLVVTMPSSASAEAVRAAIDAFKQTFPGHPVLFKTEDVELVEETQ